MALIKQAQSGSVTRDAVVLDLGDLARQAAVLKANATEEAEAIKRDAQTERERLISDAAERGYETGRAEGLESGRDAGFEAGKIQAYQERSELIEEVRRGWTRALEDFESKRKRLIDESRTDVLRLAVEIAQRVTRRAVAMDERAALGPLEAAITQMLEPTRIVVNIHPDDAEIVSKALPRLVAHLEKSPHLDIRTVDTLTRGDCILETQGGKVDARIETQLDRIVTALLPDCSPLKKAIGEPTAPLGSPIQSDDEKPADPADPEASGDVEPAS